MSRNQGLVLSAKQSPAEGGRGLHRLDSSSDVGGRIAQRAFALVQRIVCREQVEVVGLAMAQMEPGERGSAAQHKGLLSSEERLEDLALKGTQATTQ